VQFDQPLDQRQSQTQPALASIQGGVCLHEGLEETAKQLGRYAGSRIRHAHKDLRFRCIDGRGHGGASAFASELRRVLQQIPDHLCQARPIGVHCHTLRPQSDLELGFAFLEERAVVLDGPVYQIIEF